MPETTEIRPGEGRALRLPPGARFRVIDLDGKQVADLFAFNVDDVSEYASAGHTRVYVDRLVPAVGEPFVTNRWRPILRFEADDSPGVHDMLCAACDPIRYQLLGVDGWHASCQENLITAMAGLGHAGVDVPQPINLFQNIPVHADGRMSWAPAASCAGDSVTMRTELEAIVVVSACPQDIAPTNDRNPTRIGLEVID
jgi:uncharacterized protein YcgI (DUF1989 family)